MLYGAAKNGVLFFKLLILLFLISACSKNSTNPPPVPVGVDTTSHDFIWRIDTLGEGPLYSSIWDVEILNESDIWVVGKISAEDTYQTDSLGQLIQPYNAAHWNGNEWRLEQIYYHDYGIDLLVGNISGIYLLNDNNFYIAAGSIFLWDGTLAVLNYERDINTTESIKNIVNVNSISYGAGNAGLLVYNNGNGWQKIPTPTTENITDLYGVESQDGVARLFATVASELFSPDDPDSKILKIVGTEVTEVSSEGLSKHLSGIWFDEKAGYYVVGSRIYYTRTLDENSQWEVIEPDITTNYLHKIVAADTNDIFVVGDFGTVIHYNGSNWKNLSDTQLPPIRAVFSNIEIKNDLVVITGTLNSTLPTKGIILTGKRIK